MDFHAIRGFYAILREGSTRYCEGSTRLKRNTLPPGPRRAIQVRARGNDVMDERNLLYLKTVLQLCFTTITFYNVFNILFMYVTAL